MSDFLWNSQKLELLDLKIIDYFIAYYHLIVKANFKKEKFFLV